MISSQTYTAAGLTDYKRETVECEVGAAGHGKGVVRRALRGIHLCNTRQNTVTATSTSKRILSGSTHYQFFHFNTTAMKNLFCISLLFLFAGGIYAQNLPAQNLGEAKVATCNHPKFKNKEIIGICQQGHSCKKWVYTVSPRPTTSFPGFAKYRPFGQKQNGWKKV